jgi:cell wall-associated NlpC family hydrolase
MPQLYEDLIRQRGTEPIETTEAELELDSPWARFLTPMYQALDGDDARFTSLDEGWDENDPEALDFWGSDEFIGEKIDLERTMNEKRPDAGTEVLERAQQTSEVAANEKRPYDFQMPDEPDPGRRMADRTAAKRGVDPSKQGGTGQLFDLARSQLGAQYVFGAAGPDVFDCSGFVQWLYQRTAGITLPHNAGQQMADNRVKPVYERADLQPGDLLFYSYGRLGKGAVDHVEVYMGNGKQIGTSNTTEDLDIDAVDWDNLVRGGRVDGLGAVAPAGAGGAKDALLPKAKGRVVTKPVMQDSAMAPAMLSGEYGDASFSTVLAEVLTGGEVTQQVRYKTPASVGKGPDGAIKQQLYRGFMDAGREDLARMVGTKDFQTWIQAESGWNVSAVSPANNNGLRNDGLFQIWRGHEYNSNGQVHTMSPYEQAQIVAKYFGHLSPSDIRRYADSIRAGTYSGWG